MILDVTSVRDRGRWTGLYQTWFFLGTTMGSFAGGVFTDLIGYSGAMWAAALATTGGAVAALLLLPETRGARRVPYAAVAAALQPLPLRSNAGLWAAVGLQGINRFAVSGVLSATLALLVQQVSGLPAMLGVATVTGILMSGRSIVSMASAPLCGALSDRYGNRWGVLAWMVGAGVVGLALLAWGGMSGVIGGVLLTSVSSGGMQALATSITGDVVASAQRGRAIGLLHTMGDLGSALGPPFAYGLIPFIGVGGVYALCAALFVVGFVLPLSMPHRSTGSS
jgi:MFS family permease